MIITKYIRVKLKLDVELNKTLKLNNMVMAIRSIFLEGNKYYSQAFLDECLY